MKKWKDLKKAVSSRGSYGLMAHDDGQSGFACKVWCDESGRTLKVIASWGGGWDHVSVTHLSGVPTWEEMCWVKEFFFRPGEVVMQLHPAKKNYINMHPGCLHLWRPQNTEIPTPPKIMV